MVYLSHALPVTVCVDTTDRIRNFYEVELKKLLRRVPVHGLNRYATTVAPKMKY
jgi:hypothetical protein